MKVIIEGKVYDSKHTPIVLAWDTEEERGITANMIATMGQEKKPPRFFASVPADQSPHIALEKASELYHKGRQEPIQMTW